MSRATDADIHFASLTTIERHEKSQVEYLNGKDRSAIEKYGVKYSLIPVEKQGNVNGRGFKWQIRQDRQEKVR